MSNFSAGLSGRRHPLATRRGPEAVRDRRRFAPGAESLEGRIAPTVNLFMTGDRVVDANHKPLSAIYAGESVYIEADFTSVNLSLGSSYRIRFIVDGVTQYLGPISDGATLIPETAAWKEYQGPFTAQPGPATGGAANQVLVTVDPDRSVKESTYDDNSFASTFQGITAPAQLVIRDQTQQPPSQVIAGGNLALAVSVEDVFGNVVADDTGLVSVAVASGPAGTVLGGLTTVSAVGGLASFAGLSLNKSGAVTLAFSRDLGMNGVNGGTTNAINVSPALAQQLVITQPPNLDATAGDNFGLQVSVEDIYGNVETADGTTQVTATLASGAGPFLAPNTVSAIRGVATFQNLSDQTAGVITVALDSGTLAGTITRGVTIIPTFASKVILLTPPPSTAKVGQPFATQPVVAEEDRFGNLETLDNSTVVTATPAGGVGPLRGATAVVSGGLATFTGLADAKAESTSIRFSGAGVPTAATSSPVVVGKATPTISWAPAPLAVGSPLGAAQLDATAGNLAANVPGTFAYSPGAGTVLTALGPHPLAVTFTPADASDYTTATATATVQVLTGSATSLTASAATVTYKQPITFTAAVAVPTGGAAPTGSVAFFDGPTLLGTSPLDGTGHASFTTTGLPAGTPTIAARYSGDPTYAPSLSPARALHVHASAGGDYDGDGRADLALYDQTYATFYIVDSGGGSRVQPLGIVGHVNIPVVGDFDGDGKTDLAIYDQTLAEFFILESTGPGLALPFGSPAHVNVPVASDFTGDGKTDFAIYDQTAATFYIDESTGAGLVIPFGSPAHVNIPVAGDFDGDGKTDVAIYDQTGATFYAVYSAGGSRVQQYGIGSHVNIPVASDFDGDGKTDFAIYDQTARVLFALESGGGSFALPYGGAADLNIPLVGDFDGDGKADFVLYDETTATYDIAYSGGGGLVQQFGNTKHSNRPI